MSDNKFYLVNSTTRPLEIDMFYTGERCITIDIETMSIVNDTRSKHTLREIVISDIKD
jgi:hypothetical protein